MLKSYWVGWVGGWGGGPCDCCVSPSPKNWVFGILRLGPDLGLSVGSALGTCWDGGLGLGLELDNKLIIVPWYFLILNVVYTFFIRPLYFCLHDFIPLFEGKRWECFGGFSIRSIKSCWQGKSKVLLPRL